MAATGSLKSSALAMVNEVSAAIDQVANELKDLRWQVHAGQQHLQEAKAEVIDKLKAEVNGMRQEMQAEMIGMRQEMIGMKREMKDCMRELLAEMKQEMTKGMEQCEESKAEMIARVEELMEKMDDMSVNGPAAAASGGRPGVAPQVNGAAAAASGGPPGLAPQVQAAGAPPAGPIAFAAANGFFVPPIPPRPPSPPPRVVLADQYPAGTVLQLDPWEQQAKRHSEVYCRMCPANKNKNLRMIRWSTGEWTEHKNCSVHKDREKEYTRDPVKGFRHYGF